MKLKAVRTYKIDIIKQLLELLVRMQLLIESLILPQVATQSAYHQAVFDL